MEGININIYLPQQVMTKALRSKPKRKKKPEQKADAKDVLSALNGGKEVRVVNRTEPWVG